MMIRRIGAHARGDVRPDGRLGKLSASGLQLNDDILYCEGALAVG